MENTDSFYGLILKFYTNPDAKFFLQIGLNFVHSKRCQDSFIMVDIKIKSACLLLFLLLFIACSVDKPFDQGSDLGSLLINFAVISDIHYFDPSLGTEGVAFDTAVSKDRKMVAESEEILKSAVNDLISESVDFVLIPGDLTKDGELSSHLRVTEFLKMIESSGIDVYVIPGNHDINNPNAVSYSGSSVTRVKSVTPEEFEEIYKEFGYSEAIDRDPNSLSYVVEVADGLWILAMDCCRYRENTETNSLVGGEFSEETLSWIKEKLKEAEERSIRIFGMMHHGIWEHFLGQSLYFTDYVVNDYQEVAREFARLGMRIVFTGHFHANDIVKMNSIYGFLFDIETGSTVTYPCPYRLLTLFSNDILSIRSKRITNINYDTDGKTFQKYAKDFLTDGLSSIVSEMLIEELKLSREDAALYTPFLLDAMIAHLEGDESPDSETISMIQKMMTSENPTIHIIGIALSSIWYDQPPGDNDIDIELDSGLVTEYTGAEFKIISKNKNR